jgi:hypothetical protein
MKLKILFLIFALFSQSVFALEDFKDPTNGKPFFPWVWEDQLKPTLKKATDGTSVTIAASGAASSLIVHQYDSKVFNYSEAGGNLLMDEKTATALGKLGNGVAGVSVAALQIIFDQKNGLSTARALVLATTSHLAISAVARRNRPRNRTDFLPWASSFPSGHTTSAFALAGSLAYSYGWYGAVPGYLAASAIAISRIRENRHWTSDVVAGMFLGSFWARASFKAEDVNKNAFNFYPSPVDDGLMISATKTF